MTEQERSQNEAYEKRYIEMTQTPLQKLIPHLAVPSIISMLISAFYNLADTYFVSQLNTSASAAVGVIFSLMAIIQTVGFTFGMGSGTSISRALGRKDRQYAKHVFSTSFFTVFGLGVLIAVLGLSFLDPLVHFLGATETIAPYARDYARYILLATPFMATSFVLNNVLRAQGNAIYSMIGLTTGGILNLILDPIFIFGLGLGISGAAIATGISQLVSFTILLTQCNLCQNTLHIGLRHFHPSVKLYKQVLTAGMPTMFRQGLASVASIILNTAARPYGDVAIAAMSIISRYMMFINSALLGFGQGFQPVAGFNFGAKHYHRVVDAFMFCVKVAGVLMIVLGVVTFVGAPSIMALFRKDPEVIAIGTLALRANAIVMPLQGFTIMANMLSQSIGYSGRATLIAMSRQGLFFIPTLLIMPRFVGLLAIQLGQATADGLTFIMSAIIVTTILRDLKRLQETDGAVIESASPVRAEAEEGANA